MNLLIPNAFDAGIGGKTFPWVGVHRTQSRVQTGAAGDHLSIEPPQDDHHRAIRDAINFVGHHHTVAVPSRVNAKIWETRRNMKKKCAVSTYFRSYICIKMTQ